uniref:Uncharacterized protein n=1 Tax=Octopus bimaculoides TaxID=37653 RepID=A0A0L8GR96_OCTBM
MNIMSYIQEYIWLCKTASCHTYLDTVCCNTSMTVKVSCYTNVDTASWHTGSVILLYMRVIQCYVIHIWNQYLVIYVQV